MKGKIAGLIAVILILSTPAAASIEVVQTGLTTTDAITEYQTEGTVTRNITSPAMSVTYSNDYPNQRGDKPLLPTELENEWLTVCYDDVGDSIRFRVPSEMMTPMTQLGLESRGKSPVTADLRPTDTRDATVVTVNKLTKGCHTFAISKADSFAFGRLGSITEKINNVTGVDPVDEDGAQWTIVDSPKLDDGTVTIQNTSVTVQYQDGDRWVPAPEEDTDAPVYTMRVENETVIVSSVDNPPQVRWTTDDDVSASAGGVVNDLLTGVESTLKDLQSLLP